MKRYWLLVVFCFIVSCKEKPGGNNKDERSEDIKVSSIYTENKELKALVSLENYRFLESYPLKNLPIVDSTNFNNFKGKKILPDRERELLKLEEVIDNVSETKLYVNYRLALSPDFMTVVFSYFHGDNELYTYLVNYDKNFAVKGYCLIASDEVAESLFRTESYITSNRIEVREYNYFEEEPEVITEFFKIEKNGAIVREK